MCKPKIIHVIDSLTPGGSERVLVELVNGLTKHGIEVAVCISRDGVELALELLPEVETLVLKRTRTWDIGAIYRFLHYCHTNRITILHAHGRYSLKLCALIKLLSNNRLKLLFHDHFGEIAVDKAVPFWLKLISQNFVDRYVAVDIALQKWAVQYLKIDINITNILENAIDLERFQQVYDLSQIELPKVPQPLKAVMVANFRLQKDHFLLFQALAQTIVAKQQLHIFLVGLDANDQYSKKCYKMVKELGLNQNISFLGSRTDIPQILQSVDIGLLSSISESGPVTLLEYMAAKLPFLVTHTGQIAQTVHEQGLSYFTKPGDVTSYAIALDELVSLSNDDRRSLGQHGQQLVHQLFNIENQVRRLVHIYQTISM